MIFLIENVQKESHQLKSSRFINDSGIDIARMKCRQIDIRDSGLVAGVRFQDPGFK